MTPAAATAEATTTHGANDAIFVIMISSPYPLTLRIPRRESLGLLGVDLDAEGIERHGDHPIIAGGDERIDHHDVVEARRQRSPGPIRHERVTIQFISRAQQRGLERIPAGCIRSSGEAFDRQPNRTPVSDVANVLSPFVLSLAVPARPEDQQLPMARHEVRMLV